jgi:hypothetical protein
MSEIGTYTLYLACDRKSCDKGERFDAMSAVFREPTRMHAMEKARSVGWILQHGHKALCPDHATEKRESRK